MKKTALFFLLISISFSVQSLDGSVDTIRMEEEPQFTNAGDRNKLKAFAFPNPLSINSLIAYELSAESNVILSLYDCQGRLIKQLLDERQEAGSQKFFMERGELAAGLYFLNIRALDQVVSISIAVVD